MLSTTNFSQFVNQILFISSSNSFLFLLRSFWLHLSVFVKTIENLIQSSIKHFIISMSIFCGGMLPSINKNVFFSVFLLFKNSCAKSNQFFLFFSHDLAYPYHGRSTIIRSLFTIKKIYKWKIVNYFWKAKIYKSFVDFCFPKNSIRNWCRSTKMFFCINSWCYLAWLLDPL